MERVEWVDSGLSFASSWLDEATIIERAKEWHGIVVTVGQLIYEDDDKLVLGLSQDAETGNWAACFGIMKSSIVHRAVLQEVAERVA